MKKTTFNAITLVIVAALVAFFATTAALADEFEDEASRSVNDRSDARLHFPLRWSRAINVRCDRGHKLSRALRRARAGSTLKIRGICKESVVIEKDNLTLVGVGGAIIDGSTGASEAVVLIDGARGFEIEKLTVQNGADQGILATRQAQGSLTNVTLTGNGTVGLSVDRSHLEIEDVTMESNGTSGMDAFSSSTVVVFGDVIAVNNGGDGLAANGKTFLELRGAAVNASHNRGSGISIINDSRLQIFSFPEAQGTAVTANNNGFAGIGLPGSALSVVGAEFFGSGANVITASDNFLFGFFMPAGDIFSPHATAKFVAENNRVGMLMEDGANALIVGGLNVRGNGAGISAIGAGTLNLVSVPPNPSTVNLNQVDLDIGFGTRATIDGVAATDIVCDATALLRGTPSCR